MGSHNIYISGLTAAGKTTHSRLLANERNAPYFSASSMLIQRVGADPSELPMDFWTTSGADLIDKLREQEPSLDEWVDRQLQASARSAKTGVFDSWALPWLVDNGGLKIWIASSLESRVWKAIISHGGTASADVAHRLKVELSKKDEFSRKIFSSLYGFDLYTDHKTFDFIIDITRFISAPTQEASRVSIQDSHHVINTIVSCFFEKDKESLKNLQLLRKRYGNGVFVKVPQILTEIE